MWIHQRKGVDIDVCSGCGGIWLDEGEEKILSATEKPNGVGELILTVAQALFWMA